ncbi:MAG: hypothetical protein ABSF79_03650 [Smithellaceae bacterium]|jgi:hypothetical protein
MKKESSDQRDAIVMRLDALLRLFIEINKGENGFSEPSAARILKSSGLTPTDIAKILGKKSATDVSPYLYSKKKIKQE